MPPLDEQALDSHDRQWQPQESSAQLMGYVEMSLADGALLDAARTGNASAWQTLVHRYQRLIYSIPRTHGCDPSASAAIFQQTFASLWQQRYNLACPNGLSIWLATTCQRLTHYHLTRQASRAAANADAPYATGTADRANYH